MTRPPWYAVVLLVAWFWATGDLPMWRGRAARIRPSPQDRGSLQVDNALGSIAFLLGFGAAIVLRRDPRFAIPGALAWAGAALAVAAGALRWWAIATLGRYFTYTIQVEPGQPVVDRGPYRVIRHPGYAAGLLGLLGLGLACGNWASPVLLVVPWVAAYAYRIPVEEKALEETLGERWRAYARRTRRLVPFVW